MIKKFPFTFALVSNSSLFESEIREENDNLTKLVNYMASATFHFLIYQLMSLHVMIRSHKAVPT